ncbi:unnamed protein product, partial [Iphiclides podalirius]
MSNLYGKVVKVSCFTYKPYVLLDLNPAVVPYGRDGMEIRIVDEFCRWINCSIEIVRDDEYQWGEIYSYENRTGVGVLGSMVEDRVDFGITALYSWYEEFLALDFSAPCIRTGITCIAPAPRMLASWETPFLPFSLYLWIAIIFTFLYASVGLAIAQRCSTRNVLLTTFGMMITQTQSDVGSSWRIRLITGWLLITGLVLDNAYGGGLASSFTVPKYEKSIDTIKDIVDRSIEWGATHDAWIFSLALSQEPVIKKLVSQFKKYSFEELQRKSFTRSMAFSIEKLPAGYYAIGEYITEEAVLDLTIMLEDFYYEQCVIMLRKSSAYTNKLSQLIGRLHESGLLLAWETQVALQHLNYKVQLEVRLSRSKKDVDKVEPLALRHVLPGYHQPYKPEMKYVGNIHGNEVLGRELLLGLADYLCQQYLKNNPKIRALIKRSRIHLLPSMNPDGWQLSTSFGGQDYLIGRGNNHSVDLNRNFPDLDAITFEFERLGINHNSHLLKDVTQLAAPLEPETRAVMRWIMSIPFVLSAAMHGGDLVANYPYDESKSGALASEYSASPDDDTFRELAMAYASAHADMASPRRPGCHIGRDQSASYNFGKQGGVTNGAAWYSLKGGMQDFNYLATNAFEITLELGCKKYPLESELENEWNRNREALLAYLWKGHTGVKGLVRDETGYLENAIISVVNITGPVPKPIRHDVTTGMYGDYYRLLTPGQYELTASHVGHYPAQRQVTVPKRQYTAQVVNFKLQPIRFDDGPLFLDTPFNYYAHFVGDQPRIYKRSLFEKVANTMLEAKDTPKE